MAVKHKDESGALLAPEAAADKCLRCLEKPANACSLAIFWRRHAE